MLQYIIYYCFLLLGHLRATEGRLEESQNYLSASKNLLKINNKSTQLITASFLRTQKPKSKEWFRDVTISWKGSYLLILLLSEKHNKS